MYSDLEIIQIKAISRIYAKKGMTVLARLSDTQQALLMGDTYTNIGRSDAMRAMIKSEFGGDGMSWADERLQPDIVVGLGNLQATQDAHHLLIKSTRYDLQDVVGQVLQQLRNLKK